ncbi:MAG TPA: PQQ-binding-like beta-propeller repeat protein [Gaiellaceae bacterium]|nr:PQQ-binding-like beta-propeller repeat protein [Gaiellaceae bacterium]
MGKLRWSIVAVAAILPLSIVGAAAGADVGGSQWNFAGQDIKNTRSQGGEAKIGVGNVGQLAPKWVLTTDGDVSATPAVDGSKVYFPDWTGNLYAVDRTTGKQVWKASIPAATGIPGDKARATPAIDDGKVFVGTQGPFGGGGAMLAFDKNTGALLWKTQVDSHPAAIITQSAVVFNGRVYVGVASQEEAYAAVIPASFYPCCTFRGSMAALDEDTGQILWKTYMVPPGYSGGAVWGSGPAIDTKRGQLYVATGNNYSVPQSVLECVAAAGNDTAAQRACISVDNHIDAILALDLVSGQIRWATEAISYDAWTVQCILPIEGFPYYPENDPFCPEPAGPDYDFGQAPALFTVKIGGKSRDLVGAGQKSGQYWALDAATGANVWMSVAGPGGTAGGLQWGSAVDGKRVYTANANSNFKPWELPNGSTVVSGMWTGLDATTGEVLWQTAPPHGGGTSGPATTANGVMYGCSLDPVGYMYALNGATGAVLWEHQSGGSCLSGAAISNGVVYWGSGYSNFGFGTPNNKLYAFAVPGS